MADGWSESKRSYLGRSDRIAADMNLEAAIQTVMDGLNCQKSAEVILPERIYTHWEGPNNRRFPNFAGHDEMC